MSAMRGILLFLFARKNDGTFRSNLAHGWGYSRWSISTLLPSPSCLNFASNTRWKRTLLGLQFPKDMASALLQNSLCLDTLEIRSWQTPETLLDFILARGTLQVLHISVTIFLSVAKQVLDALPESLRKVHISVGPACDMSTSDVDDSIRSDEVDASSADEDDGSGSNNKDGTSSSDEDRISSSEEDGSDSGNAFGEFEGPIQVTIDQADVAIDNILSSEPQGVYSVDAVVHDLTSKCSQHLYLIDIPRSHPNLDNWRLMESFKTSKISWFRFWPPAESSRYSSTQRQTALATRRSKSRWPRLEYFSRGFNCMTFHWAQT